MSPWTTLIGKLAEDPAPRPIAAIDRTGPRGPYASTRSMQAYIDANDVILASGMAEATGVLLNSCQRFLRRQWMDRKLNRRVIGRAVAGQACFEYFHATRP